MLPDSIRICCPVVTPFRDGEVDHDALAALVEDVVDRGVEGVVPCGTTGEFASLTAAEQRRVIETTVEAAPDDVPVVAGASATSVGGARERLEAAAEAGADAALTLPPYYLTASDPAGNERFFDAVAAGSPLPIYLYNIPEYVGAAISPGTVSALAERESIVGTKDSSGDLTHVTDVMARTPEGFQVFQGYDGALAPGVFMGMTGGINALSHLIPSAMAAAVEAARAGDHERARSIQRKRIGPLFRLCRDYGFAPAVKVALAGSGVIPSAGVRPPLVLPDGDGRAEIRRVVERARREDD